MKSNYSTRLDIIQTAGTVGGQLIGATIDHLAGDLIIDTIRDEPPDEASVAAYLESIHAPSVPDTSISMVKKLWKLPYRAHPPGQVSRETQDLYEAVQQIFERDRTLGRIRRVVILADAGMGKTPALKHLCARQAQRSNEILVTYHQEKEAEAEAQLNRNLFIVPLFIDLAHLNSGVALYSLVCSAFNSQVTPDPAKGIAEIGLDQVPAFLNAYRCLVLFDGLDELVSNRDSGGLYLIRHFMDTHPEHQYVITCRTSSYREQLGAIETLYLDDLDEAQAKEVLGKTRYCRLSPSLQQLALNRGLLNQILELEGDADLLENKGQLLRLHIYQRLKRAGADSSREFPYRHLLEGVLAHVAYAMHREHTLYYDERQVMEAMRAYLERWYEPCHWRDMLQALRDLDFLERDDEKRQWRFRERSDQAYFAAAAIIAHPDNIGPILNEVSDYWWREMFEILVGLLPDPTALFFELIDRDALTAANCVQYAGRAVHGRITDAVIDALVERLGQESSARRKHIVERIGESDHPRAAEALFLVLHREWSSLVIKAIACALWGWSQSHPEIKLAAVEEEALWILRGYFAPIAGTADLYAQAVSSGKSGRKKARQMLIDRLQDPKEPPKARGLAAIYLGLLATADSGDEATWQLLLDLFNQPDIDNFVAWCATEALTECKLATVEAMALEAYRTSERRHHRARAIYLLGWVAREKSTCKLLRSALRDDDPLVRGHAIDAIANLDLPGAREEIQSLMMVKEHRETDPDVLRRMAEALGQIGTADSILVLQGYQHHERTLTRWAMRKAIDEIRQRYGL